MPTLDSAKLHFAHLMDTWESTYAYRGRLISYLLVIQIFLAGTFSANFVLGNGRSYVFSIEVSFIFCFLCLYARPSQFIHLIKQYKLAYLLLGLLLLTYLYSSTYIFPDKLSSLNAHGASRMRRFNELLAHLGFGLCIHQLLKNHPMKANPSPYFWAIFSSSVCVLGYMCYQWQLQGCTDTPCKRWLIDPPAFQNVRHLGEFLVVTAVASSSCLFVDYKMSKYLYVVLLIISSLSIASISWLGGRGSALAILVPLALFFIYMKRSGKLDLRLFYLWLVTAIVCIFILEQYANLAFLGLFKYPILLESATTLDTFSKGRLYIWQTLIAITQQSPWLGFGGDAYLFHPDIPVSISMYEHPHNAIIQLLFETGIIGVLLTLCLFTSLAVNFWRNRHLKSAREYLALLAFFALALNSLTGATFFAGITQMYATICIAIFATNSNSASPVSHR